VDSALLVARPLLVTEEHGLETRYRLLETIGQYGEQRLTERDELARWRAHHADYYASLLPRMREHAHDPRAEARAARWLGRNGGGAIALAVE
jgi:predicted ATPase